MTPTATLRLAISAIAALTLCTESAFAMTCVASTFASGTTDLSSGQVTTLLSNNTACVATNTSVSPGAPWENQEYHNGGTNSGTIVEYGQGIGSANPPSTIGIYSITPGTPDQVSYTYAAGGTFAYTVTGASGAAAGAIYDFCPVGGSGTAIPVYILRGQVACGAPV